MFIKVTLVRLDDKDKELLIPSLVNIDDIKKFTLENGKVVVHYKTYSDINEEDDQLQEDMKTIGSRMIAAKLYVPEVTTN